MKSLVSSPDLENMHILLDNGCPVEFIWKELAKDKEVLICRGNNHSVNKNLEIVKKTMNDEDRKVV